MEELWKQFLDNSIVKAVIWIGAAAGWIIGVISGIAQLKSIRDQKKFEEPYRQALEQFARDNKGKLTEKDIEDLTQKLTKLREDINKNVPEEARRMFLEDQRQDLVESMGDLYSRYEQIAKELSLLPKESLLPANLEQAIESTIKPHYIIKQRRQRTIIGLILVIFAFLIWINFWDVFGAIYGLFTIRLVNGFNFRPIWILCTMGVFILELFLWAKLFMGRIEDWFVRRSMLSAAIAFFTLPVAVVSLLICVIITELLGDRDKEWDVIPILLIGLLLFMMPVTISLLWNYYTIARSSFSLIRILDKVRIIKTRFSSKRNIRSSS